MRLTDTAEIHRPEDNFITEEPFYQPVGDEIMGVRGGVSQPPSGAAEGPTGCGKTRFMEHMAWRLQRPLITVSCHDDLTASDLAGRFR